MVKMEKFSEFITEEKDEPYKLLVLSHDDPLDPNETGPMIKKKASEMGLEVYLTEFSGMYMEDKENDQLVYSFPVNEKGQAQIPDMKDEVKYDKPFLINPKNTLIMARGVGSTVKTGNLSWRTTCLNLEHQGYTLINPISCHDICNDKWHNQIIFQQNNIRTPNTALIRHAEGAEDAVNRLDNKFPMILKTAVGSRGVGVIWIENLKSLHSVVQLLHREDEFVDIIIQEYIKTDYDVRVIIAGGKILGAIKRPIVNEDFRSNVSQGSEPQSYELTDIEAKESLRASEVVNGAVVGVDFIPTKNRDKESPYFIEVNSTPGLMGIEAVLSKAAVKPLIKGQNRSITKEILKMYMDRNLWVKSSKSSGVYEKFKHKVLGEMVGTMDTGNSAENSVIHADSYDISGKTLSFKLNGKTLTTSYLGDYKTITGSGEEDRPKIKLDLEFNGNMYKGLPFTIDDRSDKSTLLMNRDFLIQANLTINPAKEYVFTS